MCGRVRWFKMKPENVITNLGVQWYVCLGDGGRHMFRFLYRTPKVMQRERMNTYGFALLICSCESKLTTSLVKHTVPVPVPYNTRTRTSCTTRIQRSCEFLDTDFLHFEREYSTWLVIQYLEVIFKRIEQMIKKFNYSFVNDTLQSSTTTVREWEVIWNSWMITFFI